MGSEGMNWVCCHEESYGTTAEWGEYGGAKGLGGGGLGGRGVRRARLSTSVRKREELSASRHREPHTLTRRLR